MIIFPGFEAHLRLLSIMCHITDISVDEDLFMRSFKLFKRSYSVLLLFFLSISLLSACAATKEKSDPDPMAMYSNSDFIEKEQPELTPETKALISLYQKDRTMDNYLALREEVIKNYDAVIAKKEEKLAELKVETEGKYGGDEVVREMEEIVQEMYITYWSRINSTMLRFTDSRLLKWRVEDAYKYDYIPVMGAGTTIYIKRTPVTNAEYAAFIADTGRESPLNWSDGRYAEGEDDYPVNYVSIEDAEAYCKWLTQSDGKNTYRLPSESEWELAAGHMPKDADFNCGINDSRTSVEEYASLTRGAHGAVDFWGNVWEWTSTERDEGLYAVKGGSYKSERTDCRTEYRKEDRNGDECFDDVGFRVVKVLGGMENEEEVNLTQLEAPVVSLCVLDDKEILLSWNDVDNAVEYQIYEYDYSTGLLSMLSRTVETSYTIAFSNGDVGYIVEPISYTAVCDNVSVEYSVRAE